LLPDYSGFSGFCIEESISFPILEKQHKKSPGQDIARGFFFSLKMKNYLNYLKDLTQEA
jgi:hypothetical protein